MKKKIIILLYIFMSFLFIDNVNAYTCSDLSNELNNYKSTVNDITKNNCASLTDEQLSDKKTVTKCNESYLKKTESITHAYSINERMGKVCSEQGSELKKIVDENKNECNTVFNGLLEQATKLFMQVFYILGPILLILFGSLDYTKAITSNDANLLKKASNSFFKRMAALLLLFLSPAFVNIIINLSNSDYQLRGDVLVCNTKHIREKKAVTIKQIEATSDVSGGGGGGMSSSSGSASTTKGSKNKGYLNWKQYGAAWSSININCGTVQRCGCLLTSTSIQIANSGTLKNKSHTPTEIINAIKRSGGLTGGGAFYWRGWDSVAPKFELYNSQAQISGNLQSKANQLAKYIKQGYYPVVEVKNGCNGQHWVAVISVKGSKITMADPASTETVLSSKKYPCFESHNHQVGLFRVKK